MVRTNFTRKNDNNRLPVNIKVFDLDKKKVYYHDAKDVPNYMDRSTFENNYKENK